MSHPGLSIQEALQRAHQHWNAGQADQAELFCQRVLAVWPGQPDALHLLGLIAHAYGNLDLAIQHLRQACLSPRVPPVYVSNLAEMCRQRGLLKEAEQAGRRAVAAAPTLFSAWLNLGIILQEMGTFGESAILLERAVAMQPQSPEAHNNLGNTLVRLGRLGDARRCYDGALALRPSYAEASSNLAFLLNELGDFEGAARAARRAIDLNPQLADAYVNLAAVDLTRHRPDEALRWLDALMAFAPTHPGGLQARARVLKRLDRLAEALDCAQRAVAAVPQSPEAWNCLGEIQQGLDAVQEAAAAFYKAADLPGLGREQALVNQAVLSMEQGDWKGALERFDAILVANPRSIPSWVNRSELKTFKTGDPDISAMEQIAAVDGDGTQSFSDRMALRFALGKAHLDAGDATRAFANWAEGNRLKRSTFDFDIAATRAWMRNIATVMAPELLVRHAGSGATSDRPIFVVGMPRSGTSLVEQILASHADVHGAGELMTVEHLVSLVQPYPAAVAEASAVRLRQIGEAYLARIAPLGPGKRYVVDKMPANFLHVGLIRLILPEARIIHCRRDAVDTCLSCYSKLFAAEQAFAYDLAELGLFHKEYQRLTDHWRAVLPPDRFIEIDYEVLVADQEGETRRLLNSLGLAWDDRCLAFHKTARPVRTASMVQVRQPLYRSAAGRWKAHAAHLRPLLDALGLDAAP